jgi:hypothetical protein
MLLVSFLNLLLVALIWNQGYAGKIFPAHPWIWKLAVCLLFFPLVLYFVPAWAVRRLRGPLLPGERGKQR